MKKIFFSLIVLIMIGAFTFPNPSIAAYSETFSTGTGGHISGLAGLVAMRRLRETV